VAYELMEDVPDLDLVIVPIGGGGLISGCAQIIKLLNPKTRVIGVEMAGAPAMKRSIEAGRVIRLDSIPFVIDGLAVREVGDYTFEICRRFVDDVVVVPERSIFEAVVWIMERCKLVAEGAAASTVAALLSGTVQPKPGSKVACVLSGGNLNMGALRAMMWN
jgi:threonine dehydratase